MLRFDPGDERIRSTRTFRVYEGGGEYNVARNLAKCFRLDAAIVTALADNEIGRLVEDLIVQGRVDASRIIWRETDGISKTVRNGMYFWERGFGVRQPAGCSDRGNTAVSQLKPGDIVGLKEKSMGNTSVTSQIRGKNQKFSWLDWSETEMHGTFITYPERESVPENIKEQLIVELYSK